MDESIVPRLSLVEEKVEHLEKVAQGLIPFSNDPTELEIAQSQLEGIQRQLHSFTTGDIEEEGGIPRIYCRVCNVSLADCGSTEDSWYCT
jgi:hypothetical protein